MLLSYIFTIPFCSSVLTNSPQAYPLYTPYSTFPDAAAMRSAPKCKNGPTSATASWRSPRVTSQHFQAQLLKRFFFSPHDGGEAVWEEVEAPTALCSCSSITILFPCSLRNSVGCVCNPVTSRTPSLSPAQPGSQLCRGIFISYIMFSMIRFPTTGQIPGLEEW